MVKSYISGPANREDAGLDKWRETYSGIEGEEMMAAQRVEYKKIKAELREARTGDRLRRQSGGLFFAAGVPVKTRYAYAPPPRKATTPEPV